MSKELDRIIAELPNVTSEELDQLIAHQRELMGLGGKARRVDEEEVTKMAIKDLSEVFKPVQQPIFKRRF